MKTPRPNYQGLLREMLHLLRSEQYPCPGGHGAVPHSGERHYHERLENYQVENFAYDPRLGSCALCGAETYDLSRPILAEHDLPLDDTYLGTGQCPGQVQIETESEYLEYSMTPHATWPVASGSCADALGLDDDEECDDPIFARWQERRSLLHAIEQLAYRYHVDLYPYRPGKNK